MLRVISFKTKFGIYHMVINSKEAVVASGFGDLNKISNLLPKEYLNLKIVKIKEHDYKSIFLRYFSGEKVKLSALKVEIFGSAFQKKVWVEIEKIPYGKLISYKELAMKAGKPNAFRIVGTICGQNRIPIIIPCHRVIKSDGEIGSYAYGEALKAELIKLETKK